MTGKALLVLLLAPWGLAAEMKLFVLGQETERAVAESYDIGTRRTQRFLWTRPSASGIPPPPRPGFKDST